MRDLLLETRDRISFAAEGVALGAGELLDVARNRSTLIAALIAALAAIALVLLLGSGGAPDSSSAADEAAGAQAGAITDPAVVEERGFSLSLPSGWSVTETPDGAVFSASSAAGRAQTTLWLERDRELAFDSFVNESLSGLGALGSNARITDRVEGRTLETSSAELRAEVSFDGMAPGPYRVDLRAAGPYRYYLATSVEPGAPAGSLADAELIGSSLRPEVELRGPDSAE